MASDSDRPGVDPRVLTDLGAHVYDTVATLAYSGRSATSDEVTAATGLGRQTVSDVLEALTAQGVLLPKPGRDGEAYEPALPCPGGTPGTPTR